MPSSATAFQTNGTNEFRGELAALYDSWGILDLIGETAATLPPQWLRILNIARNLLDNHTIPGVPLADDLAEFFARPEYERPQVRHRPAMPRYVPPLSSDVVLRPMQSLSDYPNIAPSDLALGHGAPDLFEFRLASGDVNAYYTRELHPPQLLEEEASEDTPRPERRPKRQKVYVLLDVSNSMRDHNKLVFAKSLVLAYLIRAAEEGAELYFRTFANSVHARVESKELSQFAAVAQHVLRIAPDGGTDIKKALDTAIQDIKVIDNMNALERLAARAPTEILLISDCESYSVPYIPATVRLHTVHLADGPVAKSAIAGFESIREASATMHEINATALWMPNSTLDRWLLREELRLEPGNGAAGPAQGKNETTAKKTESLISIYDRMEGQEPKGKSGKVVNGVATFGKRGMINPWHIILAMFRAVRFLHHRPDALAWKHAHVHHARGTTFRTRR